jgi:hypothetical protein
VEQALASYGCFSTRPVPRLKPRCELKPAPQLPDTHYVRITEGHADAGEQLDWNALRAGVIGFARTSWEVAIYENQGLGWVFFGFGACSAIQFRACAMAELSRARRTADSKRQS